MHISPTVRRSLMLLMLIGCLDVLPGAADAAGALESSGVQRIAGSDQGGGGDVGQYASLARDADGGQHIAYYDATLRQLKYAHRPQPSASWAIQALTSGSLASQSGRYCSLAVGGAQSVPAIVDVTNNSRRVRVESGLALSPVLIGGTLKTGASNPAYVIAAIDADAGTISLTTAYGEATAVSTLATARFYQPVIAFQDGASPRWLRVARPRGDAGWLFDLVDGAGSGSGTNFTGFDTSVALGGDDTIHVAYRDGGTTGGAANQLRYALFKNGQWTQTTPDPAAARGFEAHIVVDKRNAPIILHHDSIARSLLATFKDSPTTGTWKRTVVDNTGNSGMGIGLTYFDPGDLVIAAYHSTLSSPTGYNELKISTGQRLAGSLDFTRGVVAEGIGVGDFASPAHGPTTGTLRLAYYDGQEQRLKALTLGLARSPLLNAVPRLQDGGADVGRFCSAMIEPANATLYTAYYDAVGRALKIANDDGVTTPVPNAFVDGIKYGTDSAIVLTSTTVAVAYYSPTEGALRLARWPRGQSPQTSPGFVDAVLDNSSANVGESVRMVADANGTLYLAYFDRVRSTLRGAVVYAGGTARTGNITGPLDGVTVGLGCDIAINRPGNQAPDRLAVAFYVLRDLTRLEPMPTLYYAETRVLPTVDTGVYPLTWTVAPALLAQADAGRFCSAVYDSANTIHLAFFDDAMLAPNYATIDEAGNRSGGEAIEGSLFVSSGLEPSIAINAATGEPAVAYYDITDGALKFAQRNAGHWSITEIDTDGDTGHTPVLRFDSVNNLARILYYDQSGGRLRLASRNVQGSEWQIVTLLDGTRGYHPWLALDEVGDLWMSFHHLATGNLLTVIADSSVGLVNRADGAWLGLR